MITDEMVRCGCGRLFYFSWRDSSEETRCPRCRHARPRYDTDAEFWELDEMKREQERKRNEK